jgi:hypothetical protein
MIYFFSFFGGVNHRNGAGFAQVATIHKTHRRFHLRDIPFYFPMITSTAFLMYRPVSHNDITS